MVRNDIGSELMEIVSFRQVSRLRDGMPAIVCLLFQ
jgi:hypothetical protein